MLKHFAGQSVWVHTPAGQTRRYWFRDLKDAKVGHLHWRKFVEKTQTQLAEERKKSNKFLIYLIIGGIAFVILFLLFVKR